MIYNLEEVRVLFMSGSSEGSIHALLIISLLCRFRVPPCNFSCTALYCLVSLTTHFMYFAKQVVAYS